MNKIEKLIDNLECRFIDAVNGQGGNSMKFSTELDELIQAVKDEEYRKHLCSLDCERSYSCDKCPAKDTKYCRGYH